MGVQIQLGDMAIEAEFKDIKNLHLSVHPPAGRVSISAPRRMSVDAVRVFVISKLAWIRSQQKKIRQQEREQEREYIDRESHYVWGKRYLLSLSERDEPPAIELRHNKLVLGIRPGTDSMQRRVVLDAWYRDQVRRAAAPLIAGWEAKLGLVVSRLYVQRMRTRWGSCNPGARSVRLNTDLAKKPPECLEYVTLHEMLHLLEPTHNARFVALMDRYMPQWQHNRRLLNRLPLRHEGWEY
jgi:predicted metal-dependent hydrolase